MALCCCLGFIGFPVSHVYAAEGGGNHYPGGNEDFMTGALPPPGTYFLNYLDFFNSHTLNGNNGQAIHAAIPGVGNLGFNLAVIAEVPRFVWVSKIKLLGGDLVGHVIVPLLNEHVSAFGSSQTKTGVGDMEAGMGIGWHFSKNFHAVFALDVVAPTGQYNKNDMLNIGNNYWSIDPLLCLTYRADNGFEASAKLMYWINTVNSETHYVSGQEFSADYLVGWHYQKWGFGANGYWRQQLTNDTQNGHDVENFKAQYFSIGPAITYDLPKGCLTFKYQFGLEAKNVPLGNSAWLKFVWAF